VWILFAGFCVVVGSEWLLSPVSGLVRGVVFAAVGIFAAALNRRWRGGWVRLAVASVLLVGMPEMMVGWGLRHTSSNLWAVVLAVMPVMVVLMVAQNAGDGVRRLLVPALAGLGGILLVVPLEVPGSVAGRLALVVLVLSAVMIAIASVWIHRLLQGFGVLQAITIFCSANALVLLVRGLVEGAGWGLSGVGWVAALVQGCEVVLLVVLLRGMAPVRFGARYLVAPLVTLVEGYVLLRPGLTWRLGFGFALMAGGAAVLLFSRGAEEGAGLSLG
jgi:drug/metabolite transporter (DMT)-like permease